MVDFSFRSWIEASANQRVQNPGGVAYRWLSLQPPESDQPHQDVEVWTFVDAMADPKKNAVDINKFMYSRGFPPETRYGPKKISGNLLKIDSPLLKNATGQIVFDVREMMFGFGVMDPVKGELIIASPPAVFGTEDKALLAGIIRHELRHAADFVSMGGNVEGVGGTGELATVDREAYLSHIMEARAYSEQLRWLLHIMGGNTKAVIRALENPRYGMDPDFRKCAEYFLEELVKRKNEAAMPHPKDVNVPYTPAAHVGKLSGMSDSKHVEQAVKFLIAILEGFRFKNVVKVPFKIKGH